MTLKDVICKLKYKGAANCTTDQPFQTYDKELGSSSTFHAQEIGQLLPKHLG
jgi:hypothetical protein